MQTNAPTKRQCKSCQAEIHFVVLGKSGKPMPCDPKQLTFVSDDGQLLTGYIPHWATCTAPARHRK